VDPPPIVRAKVASLGSRDWRGVSFSATLRKLSLALVVYHLRLQRNRIRHCNTPRSEDHIW
jgi:hypothetical protein